LLKLLKKHQIVVYLVLLELHSIEDIVLVKEALGHASTDTSMIYTHFDKERLKKAADVFDN